VLHFPVTGVSAKPVLLKQLYTSYSLAGASAIYTNEILQRNSVEKIQLF